MTDDLRQILRLHEARPADPSAVIFDSRTLQSTPESGQRAGYDGAKRRKGSKVHVAVDTLGHLLAAVVTPANEQGRAQVSSLAEEVQVASGQSVTLAYADQGYTGELPAQAAEQHGIDLQVVKLGQAKRGFVLRLRATAAPLGGRAQPELECPLQAPSPRLRTAGCELTTAPLLGFCRAYAR